MGVKNITVVKQKNKFMNIKWLKEKLIKSLQN